MNEFYEFRLYERYAVRILPDNKGVRLGAGSVSIRLLRVSSEDELIKEIPKLEIKEQRGIFSAWKVYRKYSRKEIESAQLFHLSIARTFEPAGEECGTLYDEASACPICGSGAKQVTSLLLPRKRIPSSQDISRTIAGEMVVSRRVKDLFARHGITGADFSPIRFAGRSQSDSTDWFQLMVHGTLVDVSPRTRVGIDPFDEDKEGEYRCSGGDLIGLNLLTEVSISSNTPDEADIFVTRQFVGDRRGLLRPERIVLISRKLHTLITSEKLKGFKFEVAHLD